MPSCKSCGDLFTFDADCFNVRALSKSERKALTLKMQTHCEDCARELVLGQIKPTTLNHGTGGGRRVIRDPRNMGG